MCIRFKVASNELAAELKMRVKQLADSHPEAPQVATWAKLVPLLEQFVGSRTRPTLLILLSAVGGVLLIACANVANLLVRHYVPRTYPFFEGGGGIRRGSDVLTVDRRGRCQPCVVQLSFSGVNR